MFQGKKNIRDIPPLCKRDLRVCHIFAIKNQRFLAWQAAFARS